MYPQLLTLIGTLGGALFGLLAPFITSRMARREHDLDVQRDIASEIMGLFDDGDSPAVLLSTAESRPRRKLYLLGLRLDDETARRSCMTVVAQAGQKPYNEDLLLDSWNVMMGQVSTVYRRSRKAPRR
jgi:hypothetical protein